MTSEFKVGDRVKAKAYRDSSGKDHAEVTGLVVDSVTLHGGQHGVAPYYRLNCYAENLGERLANRHKFQSVVQVEAAERFFEHDYSEASQLDADGWDAEYQSTRLASDVIL